MFSIVFRGAVIGHSELEWGDPPMGVAFGDFLPGTGFDEFFDTVPPDEAEGDEVRRWMHLSLFSPDNIELECAGICLTRYGLGDEIEFQIEVGVPYPLYETLFPHHIERYRKQFA